MEIADSKMNIKVIKNTRAVFRGLCTERRRSVNEVLFWDNNVWEVR